MRINHNIASLNTYRQLSMNNANGSKSLEKLSSGLRINRAGDDAAGLAISEKMRGQIRGLDQAGRNAQDGISMIQTAEGGLNETHSILQRMRELAVQAATDTNTTADRGEIQKEIDQLSTEITRISTDTEFNTKKLLNGDMGKILTETGGAAAFRAGVSEIQATGSDLSGNYTLTLAAVGTDTAAISSNSAITGLVAGDITAQAGQHAEYGSYRLQVSNFGATADLELTGPDGTTYTSTGAALNVDISLGGLTFNLDTHAVTSAGTVDFSFTSNGLQINMSGDKTVTTTAITAYAGETLNIGGMEFTVTANHGALNDTITTTVQDKSVKFQIGANSNQNTSLAINNMSAAALSVDALVVTNQSGANSAIDAIDAAITKVSSERSKLGAMQNRLEHTIANLGTTSENLTASESRIRDVDMAKEMMEFTKNNILSQAAQAMLAQANTQPQGVLQLLR